MGTCFRKVKSDPSLLCLLSATPQEQTSEDLKVFFQKFGTLRIVDSGESTPDALFGKLNAVVVTMVQEVSRFARINLERRHTYTATNPTLRLFATPQDRPEEAVPDSRYRRVFKLPVSMCSFEEDTYQHHL